MVHTITDFSHDTERSLSITTRHRSLLLDKGLGIMCELAIISLSENLLTVNGKRHPVFIPILVLIYVSFVCVFVMLVFDPLPKLESDPLSRVMYDPFRGVESEFLRFHGSFFLPPSARFYRKLIS